MTYHRYFQWSTPGFDGIVEGRCCCPCCGYPTLGSWSEFEICQICWWEDDGQGDRTADQVAGGPNGSYSLTEARGNFEDDGDKYRYDTTRINVVSNASPERLALLQYVRNLEGNTELDCETFFRLLRAA
jgi:Cysteine-rich CPCC